MQHFAVVPVLFRGEEVLDLGAARLIHRHQNAEIVKQGIDAELIGAEGLRVACDHRDQIRFILLDDREYIGKVGELLDLRQVDAVLVHDVLAHAEADRFHKVGADAQHILVSVILTGVQPIAEDLLDAAAVLLDLRGDGLQIALADPGIGRIAEAGKAV